MYPHIQQFASWLSQFKRNSPLRSHSVVEASICGRLCTHSGTNSPHMRLNLELLPTNLQIALFILQIHCY